MNIQLWNSQLWGFPLDNCITRSWELHSDTYQDGGQLLVVKQLCLVDLSQLLAERDTTLPGLAPVKQADNVMVEALLPLTRCLLRIVTNRLQVLT